MLIAAAFGDRKKKTRGVEDNLGRANRDRARRKERNTSKIVDQFLLCICEVGGRKGSCECVEIEGLHGVWW
jgi:hypothetical protein